MPVFSRGGNKVYLFNRSFFGANENYIVVQLLQLRVSWWCSKSPIWSSSFIAGFHHSSCKERPDLQKINLFTLIQYFSQKIRSSTVILFPAPLKSKARCKVHNFAKPAFQELLNVITHKHFMKYNPFGL